VSACAAPFGLVTSPALVAASCHGVFGVLVLKRRSSDWQKLEGRGLGERLGAPEVLIYGTGKEIMARDRGAYPEKFGGGETSLTESSSGRLEFKLSHIRFDWLKFG
jgi:hypothetical protein